LKRSAFRRSAQWLGALAARGIANASIQNPSISGSLDGHAYGGELSLDVFGGQAVSGTGTLSILGLNNAPLVLIMTSTPGNEGGPIGSAPTMARTTSTSTKPTRSAPTAYCSMSARPRRKWGLYPLFAIWSEGTATPPPSPATSAEPSTTTSKAARWRPALPPARKAKPSEADASIAHAESYGTAPVAEAEPAGCSRLKTETRSTDLSAGLASSSDAAPDVRSDKEGSG
jgi:hypothetical protein